MDAKRAQIRRYITAMLRASVDVGERVFSCRPDPVFITEVPCLLVYYSDEGVLNYVGDKYNQKITERLLTVNVDVWSDQVIDPDTDPRKNEGGEDRLDWLAYQVELAFWEDQKLAKRLPAYNANTNYQGLALGTTLLSVEPDEVSTDGNTRLLVQRMAFQVNYDLEAYQDKKYNSFEEYKADIYRADYTSSTVDPILISAEGDLPQ